MADLARLAAFTIYRNPSDFPGRIVVRRHFIHADDPVPKYNRAEADPMPWFIGRSKDGLSDDALDVARASLPQGLVNLGRYAEDDPVIVEVWI